MPLTPPRTTRKARKEAGEQSAIAIRSASNAKRSEIQSAIHPIRVVISPFRGFPVLLRLLNCRMPNRPNSILYNVLSLDLTQVLRYNTGSAIKGSKWSPAPILEQHTWTALHGEALEPFPRKKRVSSCVGHSESKTCTLGFLLLHRCFKAITGRGETCTLGFLLLHRCFMVILREGKTCTLGFA